MLFAAILVAVFSVMWLVLYVMPRRRIMTLTKTIPGPTGLPLLGSALMLTGSPSDTLNKFVELQDLYGSIYKIWIGPKLYILIRNPADAKCLLMNPQLVNRDKNLTKAIGKYLGDGLTSSRDVIWRRHHKIISPAFHYDKLKPYLNIFQKKANSLVDKLEEFADGRVFDIHHHVVLCMLDAICETAMGVDMRIQENEEDRLNIVLLKAQDMIIHHILHPWLLVDWIYAMSDHSKKTESVVKLLHSFTEEIIATKLEIYRNGSNESRELSKNDKTIESFLDIIIDASERGGQILSPEEMRDEVSTMALTGTGSVAGTLSFALLLLGLHPEHQDKIDEELLEVFGDSDREATIEDIQKLKHVEYCLKETLRLFPLATFIPREIDHDVEITEGRILPAGSIAMVFPFAIHRCPEYYPDAEKFIPERWSPENSIGRQANAYLPFSFGVRMCVASKYALLILPTVLIVILRRYRVSCTSYTLDELSKNAALGIVLYSSIGYKIQLEKK